MTHSTKNMNSTNCNAAAETVLNDSVTHDTMKRGTDRQIRSASWCCEASETISVEQLPQE